MRFESANKKLQLRIVKFTRKSLFRQGFCCFYNMQNNELRQSGAAVIYQHANFFNTPYQPEGLL